MVGQLLEAAQVPGHDFQRHVVADAHDVEVHQGTDGVLRVGHRGAQLLALLDRQRLEDVLDDLVGEVGRELGDLVGVEVLDRGDELVRVHRPDDRLADRFRQLEQDLAVALRLDEVPDDEALVDRQRLEDVGDVGRVHLVELRAQLGEVLLVHERLDQLVLAHRLPLDQAFDEPMPPQQLPDALQVLLQVFEFLALDGFGHDVARRVPV